MPINLLKNGSPTLIKLKSCGIKNFPEVARKNNIPATITIKIKFLYNLELLIDTDLALDLKINKIITITAKTINKRNISFCIFR